MKPSLLMNTLGGRRLLGPAIILCAAAVAVLPQVLRGTSCGHDFDFHLVAWMDALNSWRHGIPYPHWAVSANYAAGEPRFVFYPPLTWMLGAALGAVLPWQLVPLALIFLLLAATGLATRALAGEALSDGAATLAGCVAIFSGYALFTAYERSAFGELAGGFWIPLLLLFILRDRNQSLVKVQSTENLPSGAKARSLLSAIYGTTKVVPFQNQTSTMSCNAAVSLPRRAFDGSALPLALVVAGCWLSNAPLGVMASYLLVAVALAAALLARSWAPVLRAAVAAALGTALTGLYLLPAIYEQRWVDIHQVIDDPGLRIENSWLFARHADPALALHDAELRQVSLLAVAMIAVTLLGAAVCWWRSRLAENGREDLRLEGDGLQPVRKHDEKSSALAAEGEQTTLKNLPRGLKPSSTLDFDVRAKAHTLQKILRWMARLKPCLFKAEPASAGDASKAPLGCRWWLPLALIPVLVLLLQFPFSLPVWNLLPKLRFLQFPWRWLVVIESPLAVFVAAALWSRRPRLRLGLVAGAAACFLAVLALANHSFYQVCYPEDTVAGVLAVLSGGVDGYDEYAPPGADNTLVATGLADACLVTDPSAQLGVIDTVGANPDWWEEQGSCDAVYSAQLNEPERKRLRTVVDHDGYLILRLRAYPAWRVMVNGQPVSSLPQRDDGLMAVPVTQGPVDLVVDWRRTPDVLAGLWLSALAALLLAGLGLLERMFCTAAQKKDTA